MSRNKNQYSQNTELSIPLLLGRLDEIHADVREIRTDVRVLQDDFVKRKFLVRGLIAVMSAATAGLLWCIDQVIRYNTM